MNECEKCINQFIVIHTRYYLIADFGIDSNSDICSFKLKIDNGETALCEYVT